VPLGGHAGVVRRSQPEVLVFHREAATPAVDLMRELARAHGWLTLQPVFDRGDMPANGGHVGLFSGRGPAVPVCSWVPGEHSRKGVERVAVGIEHGSGTGALARLADLGVSMPERWVVLQDNPRRGLVVAVPPADEPGDVLAWLLDAATALSLVPLSGEWRALVYRR
jgi:hypothetical protein